MTDLSLGKQRLDLWPSLALSGVTQEVHDNGTSVNGFFHLEEVLSGDPTILNSLLPRGPILAHADDDVETVITEVEALTVALGAISDQGKCIILVVILREIRLALETLKRRAFLRGACREANTHVLRN